MRHIHYTYLFSLLASTSAFHIVPSTKKLNSRKCSTHCPTTIAAIRSPLFYSHKSSSSTTQLFMSDTAVSNEDVDPLIVDTSEVLGRISWLSWWAQVILTVIAAITLLFARNVTISSTPQNNSVSATIGPGFVLAGAGLIASAISIFWTWGAARLSKKLRRNPSTSRVSAANLLRRAVKTGCVINLVGMLTTLLGAEQIVGALAIKVLTQSGIQVTSYGQMPAQLQPLDILIVQANTNTLLSHYCSLVGFLWLVRFIGKLDPPSKNGKERGKRT